MQWELLNVMVRLRLIAFEYLCRVFFLLTYIQAVFDGMEILSVLVTP